MRCTNKTQKKKKMHSGRAAKVATGQNELGWLEVKKNCLSNFCYKLLNSNQRLKYKSNIFLNSNKFKYFTKTEI
jgi:hypothetical protein